jgi:hypothetical protein
MLGLVQQKCETLGDAALDAWLATSTSATCGRRKRERSVRAGIQPQIELFLHCSPVSDVLMKMADKMPSFIQQGVPRTFVLASRARFAHHITRILQ